MLQEGGATICQERVGELGRKTAVYSFFASALTVWGRFMDRRPNREVMDSPIQWTYDANCQMASLKRDTQVLFAYKLEQKKWLLAMYY